MIPVSKTYKNFVGGAYTRPESGKTIDFLGVRVPASSRKDFREAVEAARKASIPASSYNRGQIVYRLSEMLSARSEEFVSLLQQEGMTRAQAEADVALAVDRIVYLAGWADKYSQVLSSVNPVEGAYFVSTAPEPTGVSVLAAPSDPGLTLWLTRILSAFLTGNPVVSLFESSCLSRLTFAELFQSSDFPAGTVNLLSGDLSELLPQAASHKDVWLLDLPLAVSSLSDLQELATSNLKRILMPFGPELDPSSSSSASPSVLHSFCEDKTVWHPLGF